MNSNRWSSARWAPLFGLLGLISLWCIYLAVGSYLRGHDFRKPLIILAVWLAAGGGWSVLLYRRYLRGR
ncbi:MAG: hypothetical protein FJ295_06625 [Planctomycetes bacterium]|nr:hypothetical protein [Planctomycetota bacterium]